MADLDLDEVVDRLNLLIETLKEEAKCDHPLVTKDEVTNMDLEDALTNYAEDHDFEGCYDLGVEHGRALFAMELLEKLGVDI